LFWGRALRRSGCRPSRSNRRRPLIRFRPLELILGDDRCRIEPTTSPGFHASLPDLGAAPELHNEVWLNTDRPLRLADLQGKVVLLDMWTFG
jgi:hypothetical protein